MKISMMLTMDGLIRALRWKAHVLVDDAVQRSARDLRSADRTPQPVARRKPRSAKEARDVRSGS